MNPALILSPHFDDAVLSAGDFLAGRPDAWVATVCTGFPNPPIPFAAFDVNCGFVDSSQAMAARRLEDRAALGLLGAERIVHLDYLDGQYRARGRTLEEEAAALKAAVTALLADLCHAGGDLMLAPLGIVHPDHEATSNAALAAWRHLGRPVPLYLYEDLPARVLEPYDALRRLEALSPLEFVSGAAPAGARKRQAVAEYRSQLWAVDSPAVYVPERLWRVLE